MELMLVAEKVQVGRQRTLAGFLASALLHKGPAEEQDKWKVFDCTFGQEKGLERCRIFALVD